jgi:peptidoglycan/xylan/chitin deacetylase (PgdA/CDA1 family)
MTKALFILGLALIGIAASLTLAPAPASWIVTAGILTATVGLFAWAIFRNSSNFWAETLCRSPRASRTVALTFDDGPDERFTPRILDILAAKGVPATFFVVGERAERYPDLVRRAHDLGHVIGNHTYTHSLRFHFRHGAGLRREVSACGDAIRAAIGREPRLFRAPQGVKTPPLGDVLAERGMTAVGWQVRGMDYVIRDPKRIARRLVEGAADGGVLLLHDGGGLQGTVDRSATLHALPLVIDGLRARGFSFQRLDRLFDVPAYLEERAAPTTRESEPRTARDATRAGGAA